MIAFLKLSLVYLTALTGAGLVVGVLYAPARAYFLKRFVKTKDSLIDLYIWVPTRRLWLSFCVSPLLCAGIGWMVTHHLVVVGVATLGGVLVPEIVTRFLGHRRLAKFNSQLVDALLSLSGSLKAGLSVPQALEVVTEELPAPLSQEFSLVVKEVKMGLMLNEALGYPFSRNTKKKVSACRWL